MSKKIKLFDPIIGKEEERILNKVLKSGFWASGAGTGYVSQFENKFCKYIDAKECIAVNSGTAALHLALSGMNLQGKEVILPSLSFVSTAHAVVYNGGKPIFADVDPVTLCLDPKDVEKKISSKTKVILPVHFAGMPSNLNALMKIAKKFDIQMVEDAAHACGATYDGKRIGRHSDLVCFSFHPVKNLAMPSGGLIAINRPNSSKLKQSFASKRWCGITDRKEVFYNVKEIGWNFYLNEFSAAIGLVQLKKLDHLNEKRKRIAKRYYDEICLEKKMTYNKNCCYHFYWILVKNRSQFRKNMHKRGIETGIHYTPIHEFSMYDNTIANLPETEKIGSTIVSLPTHPNLDDDNVSMIINNVNKFSKSTN
jgi:dTDP-4-amino-4,6-dideoxygalactose transaminase